MTHGYRHRLLWAALFACITPATLALATNSAPSCSGNCNGIPDNTALMQAYPQPAVSIYIDNDIFTSTNNDKDYTAGFAVAFSGASTIEHPLSIFTALSFINNASRMSALLDNSDLTLFTREAGLTVFTPKNLDAKQPVIDDRPYASLIYLANTQQNVFLGESRSWISTVSIGLLGIPAVGSLQNAIHQAVNTDKADGWDHQISSGGEPTFKYSLARQSYHNTGNGHIQFTTASGLSLGYITEAFYGGSVRMGLIQSPAWNFNVYTSNYGEKSDVVLSPSRPLDEIYVFAGTNIKLRAYNVFLQGQFRESDVTYSASEVEWLILEGWAGIASEVSSGLHLGYIVRVQSSEVKTGKTDKKFTYGELTISYTFRD